MDRFPCAVLSVVKHDYLPNAVAAHPRFELKVVADDPDVPEWIHARNQLYADQHGIPYIKDIEQAIKEFEAQVAVVSSEAERHCELSTRAANFGLHVVQDKPMSTVSSECDRLVEAVDRNQVKFMMWTRNRLPALVQAQKIIDAGGIGELQAIHVDFYFSKDAGPAKGSQPDGEGPLSWLQHQIAAHADGSDGGVGRQPMGELQVEGIYPLAYIHMLAGAEVKRVFARTASHFHQVHHDNDVEDLATVTLEMANGLVGSLCLGRIGAASHPDIGEIKIHAIGSEGGTVVSESRPEVGVYYRDQPAKEFKNIRVANNNDCLLLDDFVEAIEQDRETLLDARASRAIFATVQAAVESGRSGQAVEVV